MDSIISKGRFRTGQGILRIAIITGLLFFSWFILQHAFSFKYLQIERLIAAIAFTFLFLYIIFKGLVEYKAVNIYENHLKVKWLYGLIAIQLDKDKLRLFGQTSSKNISSLYLRTEKYDLLFNKSFIENNLELIDQLREWRIKRKDNLHISDISKLEKKAGGFAVMIAGVIMFSGILYNSYINPISTTDIHDLTAISGHLSKEPEVDKPTFRSASPNVTFNLEEYPGFSFEIGTPGYKAINLNQVSKYKKGDETILYITKNDYLKKITHLTTATFTEKHFKWPEVTAYDIEIEQEKILRLDNFNKEALSLRKSNQMWGLVAIGLAVFLFWSGLKSVR